MTTPGTYLLYQRFEIPTQLCPSHLVQTDYGRAGEDKIRGIEWSGWSKGDIGTFNHTVWIFQPN